MKRGIGPVLVAAMALTGAGCFRLPDVPSGGSSSGGGSYGYGTEALAVSNGTQSGSMGEIASFEGAASQHSGYYSRDYANLRIDSIGSDWWVMSSISVTGDLAALLPGTHRTFTSGVYGSGDDPSVSVTGCSGPEYGNYTFDSSGSVVEVEVQDRGGGTRRMIYSVTFYDGTHTNGSVDYRIGDGV